MQIEQHVKLATGLCDEFKKHQAVKAIAIGGALTDGRADKETDIDLYVFTQKAISLNFRKKIVEKIGASKTNLDLKFWDHGDQWIERKNGVEVDVIFWDVDWIEGQISRTLKNCQASLGYSTCHWHILQHSKALFDRTGWFGDLQKQCFRRYPARLKRNIIAHNYPVLRSIIPSYYNQIKKAVQRADLISVNHRLAALFASYFDILFALNELPHPGEKKLLKTAQKRCKILPADFEHCIGAVLTASAETDYLLHQLDYLLANLDILLEQQGFDPAALA